MKTIIFSGGGSGGHVRPAITLIEKLIVDEDFKIFYIGSKKGIERNLVSSFEQIKYFSISTGKLRRYFSLNNFLDIFKVFIGFIQSFFILLRISKRDSIVFSTGGFVSVPVVIAAKILGRNVFIHEQTCQVGLANKISSFFANKIFISFENSRKYFPKDKVIFSGYPVRDTCFSNIVNQVKLNNIVLNDAKRPILFVTGGGNGSLLVNSLIKKNLNKLKEKYLIIHQVGYRFIDDFKELSCDNYIPIGFIKDDIIDLYKLARIIISRSGAGTVSELIVLNKKSIYIPLKIAQKNEQYLNAIEAQNQIGSKILEEKDLDDCDFLEMISKFDQNLPETSEIRGQDNDAKEIIISYIKAIS